MEVEEEEGAAVEVELQLEAEVEVVLELLPSTEEKLCNLLCSAVENPLKYTSAHDHQRRQLLAL